ncbi:MAG TPA: DUF6456 domain-containing protein [Brevundimonas sp.]|jgi:hypothetical protein|uniref:DUF6456 domain-containing protein n=1 Tax=Brevundimonas sp. TaxID=1871086 RepID=UPI002EDB67CC
MSASDATADPVLDRATRLLARPHGWIDALPDGGYGLRVGRDRRSRVLFQIDEALFRRLAERPGLKGRSGGGWIADARKGVPEAPGAGRPGVIEGARATMDSEGRTQVKRANLGHSAIAWLASRKDGGGEPWLAPRQVAAAHRLGRDAEVALRGASVTMRWDGLPRSGAGGRVRRADPGAGAAARRVEAALAACGAARGLVDAICIRASALQAAEQDLGLRRRAGKELLRAGLTKLAAHYRIG